MSLDDSLAGYGRRVRELVGAVAQCWPEHETFLMQRFGGGADDAAIAETVAARILRILGDRGPEAAANYRWTCQMMLTEEYRFRLTGGYRHSSFAEAAVAVYQDSEFMRRYMDGLLLSQLLWANHSAAIADYSEAFLSRLRPDARLLEVGPGHGLLLALAAERLTVPVHGWDISPTSLCATREALAAMGVTDVVLELADLMTASATESFDAVVASELLEHLEEPGAALARLRQLVRPGGLLFLNVPVNSPAPDHIYLWRTPEAVRDFVEAADLAVVTASAHPMTGKTEAQARAEDLTLSCVVVCRRVPDQEAGVAS